MQAGAIGSPHLLLHSGIGPADELKALGVTPVINLPGVGRNLRDHPKCWVQWKLHDKVTIEDQVPGRRLPSVTQPQDLQTEEI